jgi:hypothetical protein
MDRYEYHDRTLRVERARNPRLVRMEAVAEAARPGDIVWFNYRAHNVVRVYPHGQSGCAPFLEISVGGVCFAIYGSEPVVIYRDPTIRRDIIRWENPNP